MLEGGVCRDGAVLAVAVGARPQQQHRRQGNPAPHGVHHHRTGKVVKSGPCQGGNGSLDAKVPVPGDAFKKWIDKAHDGSRCQQLGPELGTLCNAARHNGRNGRRKREQKEELHERIAVVLGQGFCTHKEMGAIRHAVAHHKIHHRGNRKIHQNFDQRIHLVLFAHGAQLQKRKPRVHGQHHDGAQQNKQGIAALWECIHNFLVLRIDRFWCAQDVGTRFAPKLSKIWTMKTILVRGQRAPISGTVVV